MLRTLVDSGIFRESEGTQLVRQDGGSLFPGCELTCALFTFGVGVTSFALAGAICISSGTLACLVAGDLAVTATSIAYEYSSGNIRDVGDLMCATVFGVQSSLTADVAINAGSADVGTVPEALWTAGSYAIPNQIERLYDC